MNPVPIPSILAAMAIAIAPQLYRLPTWVVIWVLSGWGWSLLAWQRKLPWPGAWTRNALAAIGFLGCMLSYGLTFHRSLGVAVLSVMMGLKVLEVETHRDRMMIVFLILFMILTNLLYSNSLSMLVYMLGATLVSIALLLRIHDPGGPVFFHGRLAAKMLAGALPVMIVLFFLFPRIQGGILRLPESTSGQTGFVDRIEPGSISSLVLNRQIAFRASFSGSAPPAGRLYWRGRVFDDFDGRTWFPKASTLPLPAGYGDSQDTVVTTIDLEPHQQTELFALDPPVSGTGGAVLYEDGTLRTPTPVKDRIRYTVRSMKTPSSAIPPPGRNRSLTLPPTGNERARRLARQWQEDSSGPEQIIEQALGFFQENDFSYTLTPPLLGQDAIDDFLFETRKGFCEHYASAFVFLMRAAGLPARIVGGYLGAERNPYGDYWIVRQSEAHAWAEIWSSDTGWLRIDPTSAVVPSRIGGGNQAALPPGERDRLRIHFVPPFLAGFLNKGLLGWDAVNTFWSRQIMGYSAASQRRFFRRLGFPAAGWGEAALAFVAGLGLFALVAAGIAARPRRGPSSSGDSLQKTYLGLCKDLAKRGYERPAHQGPLDYLESIAAARPGLAEKLRPVIDLYVRLRFAEKPDPEGVRGFKRSVRRFLRELGKAKY